MAFYYIWWLQKSRFVLYLGVQFDINEVDLNDFSVAVHCWVHFEEARRGTRACCSPTRGKTTGAILFPHYSR